MKSSVNGLEEIWNEIKSDLKKMINKKNNNGAFLFEQTPGKVNNFKYHS